MSWDGGEPTDLYLGDRQVAVCVGPRLIARADIDDWSQGAAQAPALLKRHRPAHAVRVWLGGGLCRPFLLPEAAATLRRGEREQLRHVLARRTLACPGVPCTVWSEAPPPGLRPVAVGVQTVVLTRLHQAVSAAGARVGHVGPWWAEALNRLLAADGTALVALAVHDGDAVTVLRGRGPSFDEVRTIAPVEDRAAALATLSGPPPRPVGAAEVPAGDATVQWRWVRLLAGERASPPACDWPLSPMVEFGP